MEELRLVDVFYRIGLAVLLSGLLGIEREWGGKPAGLRTNMLVSLGATVFTMLSIYAFPEADTARIAAQIVVGIGFIGTGAIIFLSGEFVVGLTTAAILWTSAAIGMACGAGMMAVASVATGSAVFVLFTVKPLEDRFIEALKSKSILLRMQVCESSEFRSDIVATIESNSKTTKLIGFTGEKKTERSEYFFRIKLKKGIGIDAFTNKMMLLEGVESIRWDD